MALAQVWGLGFRVWGLGFDLVVRDFANTALDDGRKFLTTKRWAFSCSHSRVSRLLTLLQLVFSCGVEERLRVKGRGKPKKEK